MSKKRLKTVGNALQLLSVLSEESAGMGVSQLSRRLHLTKSTTHLLLQTLADFGFVETDGVSGRYRLGLRAFEVGTAAVEHRNVDIHLMPPMERLADLSKEAVSLAVLHDNSALMVYRFESTQILRADIRVGTRMALHVSASGKVLLADLPVEQIKGIYPREVLPDAAPHGLRRRSKLLAELRKVWRSGYALNVDEFVPGVSAIACPVRDRFGRVVAALGIAGPTGRFDADRWLEPLLTTGAEMSAILGWRDEVQGAN